MNYSELITLLAGNAVADIDGNREYIAYCARNLDKFGFREEREQTETAKKVIEERLDTQASGASQVSEALKLLKSRRNLDLDLYYELIVAGYKPRWSEAQQRYFEHAVRIIRSGNYFFFSFTSRGPETPGADKAINRRYWHYIRRIIVRPKASDRTERNLLADAIETSFRDEGLEGFYYKRHDKDGSVLMSKLRAACESCLVFVQLVDNPMFAPPRDPNYCALEYQLAKDFIAHAATVNESRILFLVAANAPESLPDPQTVYSPYRQWVDHIRSKSDIYLPPVPEYDKPTIDRIRANICSVAGKIKQAEKDLLDHVPA